MILIDLYHQCRQSIDPLEARLLICHVLNMTHEEFILRTDRFITPQQQEAILALIAQRQTHRPISKIIGKKEFYGREFITNDYTLDPRPDTEALIAAALRVMPMNQPCRVLDLGAGTGCVGLTLLAERPHATLVSVDTSPHALHIVERNAALLGVGDRVSLIQSNWCEAVTGRFEVVVSNPPYIPSSVIPTLAEDVKAFDPLLALDGGVDGLDAYRTILASVGNLMVHEAWIFFEVGYDQADAVAQLLGQTGFSSIKRKQDLSGIERVVAGCRS